MEVFPTAAMVVLFDLKRPLSYKKRRGRSWELCREGLAEYLLRLRALRHPRLAVPSALTISNEIGVAFKRIEDQTDAALCAYLAGLAWLYGDVRMDQVGTLQDGYIVLPKAVSVVM